VVQECPNLATAQHDGSVTNLEGFQSMRLKKLVISIQESFCVTAISYD
jgi:hypothetical protein